MQIPIKKAILSVYDKTGLLPLCKALKAWGVELYATQGTTKFLKENGAARKFRHRNGHPIPGNDGRAR